MQIETWDVLRSFALHPEFWLVLAFFGLNLFAVIVAFFMVLGVDFYEAYWMKRPIPMPKQSDLITRELVMPLCPHIYREENVRPVST